jgi:SAM-dependent methyltransferase
MAARLAATEIAALDPYKFMAVIGKRVIHPGGRASTESLLRRAAIAGMASLVTVEEGDILSLPYADDAFDVVIAEGVTMFVDRARAAEELVRVAKPGGRVRATECIVVAGTKRA